MNKKVLITGATSGIGYATAKLLAKNNFNLIITGRRNDRLQELKKELESAGASKVLTICFDVRIRKQVIKAISELPAEWRDIDVLVNNAGLASGFGHIQDGDIEDWEKMIDTNIKGLLYVTKEVMPIMVSQKKGHIINRGPAAQQEHHERGQRVGQENLFQDRVSAARRPERDEIEQIGEDPEAEEDEIGQDDGIAGPGGRGRHGDRDHRHEEDRAEGDGRQGHDGLQVMPPRSMVMASTGTPDRTRHREDLHHAAAEFADDDLQAAQGRGIEVFHGAAFAFLGDRSGRLGGTDEEHGQQLHEAEVPKKAAVNRRWRSCRWNSARQSGR